MPNKQPEKNTKGPLPRGKRSPRRLDSSLYSAEGYLNWLAKAQKAKKRKH